MSTSIDTLLFYSKHVARDVVDNISGMVTHVPCNFEVVPDVASDVALCVSSFIVFNLGPPT